LIDRCIAEFTPAKGFGKNKSDVLRRLRLMLGDVMIKNLTGETLTDFVRLRMETGNGGKGAGGVTISGDIGGLLTV
jgi:hypothetical protein